MITDNKIDDSRAIVNVIPRQNSHLSRHWGYLDHLEGLPVDRSRHFIGRPMEMLDMYNTIGVNEHEKFDYLLSMEVII